MKLPILSALPLLLAACTTSFPTHNADEERDAKPTTEAQFADIATTPLSDLNLVKIEIPSLLVSAQKRPYALPGDMNCAALAADVQAINAVLGADLDVPASRDNPSLVERGSKSASDAAMGAVRGAAEGIVPFRSWVRKLSGAERHSKDVAAAIAAGSIRRAFLKGLGQAAGCPPPASPHLQTETPSPSPG